MPAEINPQKFCFDVEKHHESSRLDNFLKLKLPDYSRSQIQKWIGNGHVFCGDLPAKSAQKLKEGETIQLEIPEEESKILAEKIPLKILYEDDVLLAINKPAGMLTHPAPGVYVGTVANAVAHHIQGGKAKKGSVLAETKSLRPGIVHRLDKDTSGILLVAKNVKTLESLSRQFRERSIQKTYRAIVCGNFLVKKGEIEGAIGRDFRSPRMAVVAHGRFSRTDFKALKKFKDHAYIEVYPKTGRTHQIRVHLAKIGFPILADTMYGKPDHLEKDDYADRQMLHAYKIQFQHPVTKKTLRIEAPLPQDFLKSLKLLESKSLSKK
jgi:23S rRNA pseudouridine1911/1915/1917 synthase